MGQIKKRYDSYDEWLGSSTDGELLMQDKSIAD